jgi:hypothetical protein
MRLPLSLLFGFVAIASAPLAGETPADRLPAHVLDVRPPSSRVRGEPGTMTVLQAPCRNVAPSNIRQRIIDVAVQEWGFFGFTVVDHIEADQEDEEGGWPRRSRRLAPEQAIRVASSIAGYWAVTPSGGWILDNQNRIWNGEDGAAARWRYPWSAAFISWVMCESGFGSAAAFQRAVAHHVYIDQAIRARNDSDARAAYVAYDRGEAAVSPGDMLCSSRRPVYRTLAERRRQMGAGARTHCDIVVKVDGPGQRLYAIGGNVRGSVSLKVLPMAALRAAQPAEMSSGRGARPFFAHLKLRAAPLAVEAFDASPTLRALNCANRSSGLIGHAPACALSLD